MYASPLQIRIPIYTISSRVILYNDDTINIIQRIPAFYKYEDIQYMNIIQFF